MHATDKDSHELLDYICSIAKPHKMDVQTYYSCLHELNHQVDWLPGTDLPLTEDQLHQAFFDGMPTIWKERYENASRSICNREQGIIKVKSRTMLSIKSRSLRMETRAQGVFLMILSAPSILMQAILGVSVMQTMPTKTCARPTATRTKVPRQAEEI
jgi:hypothetical protein